MTQPRRKPAGRVRVDCHLHTVASGDAVLTLAELAERARQAALDVVCITDHNVTSAAVAAAGRDLGVRVVVGEEIRTPDGDVIGLFLTTPGSQQPSSSVKARVATVAPPGTGSGVGSSTQSARSALDITRPRLEGNFRRRFH